MMTTKQKAEYSLAEEIHHLAYEMVHLEGVVRHAISTGEWADAGAANQARMEVQLQRSNLMYDLWTSRHSRRRA